MRFNIMICLAVLGVALSACSPVALGPGESASGAAEDYLEKQPGSDSGTSNHAPSATAGTLS